jgi:hypothetical protein
MKFRNPKDKDNPPNSTLDASKQQVGKGLKNIRETMLWKDSVGGFQRFWQNYLSFLSKSWQRLPRFEQENWIRKFSLVVTVGTAFLAASFFYQFLPSTEGLLSIRTLSLPILIAVSWWTATRVITPVMIDRLSKHLNKEF